MTIMTMTVMLKMMMMTMMMVMRDFSAKVDSNITAEAIMTAYMY